jgi:3-phenylpropionate/trans-cinnamate dioxygenase ferredoxin component
MTWTDAGPDLAEGELREVHLNGLAIGVTRAAGELYAFEVWCTHADCPLTDGTLEGSAIRCSCHGALFRLADGVPLEGPATDPIRIFPVRFHGERMEVDL